MHTSSKLIYKNNQKVNRIPSAKNVLNSSDNSHLKLHDQETIWNT